MSPSSTAPDRWQAWDRLLAATSDTGFMQSSWWAEFRTAAGFEHFVTTEIDNRSGLLKPGMTGLAKVLGGDRRVVDIVTRRLGHTFKVEFWSWW